MQAALKNTILRVASVGHSNGGQVLATLMTLAHAPNTWRNQAVGWKKWVAFCAADRCNPLALTSRPSYATWSGSTPKVASQGVVTRIS
jgi:hypothetical protein